MSAVPTAPHIFFKFLARAFPTMGSGNKKRDFGDIAIPLPSGTGSATQSPPQGGQAHPGLVTRVRDQAMALSY